MNEEIKWLKGCNQYTQLDWMKMPNKCNLVIILVWFSCVGVKKDSPHQLLDPKPVMMHAGPNVQWCRTNEGKGNKYCRSEYSFCSNKVSKVTKHNVWENAFLGLRGIEEKRPTAHTASPHRLAFHSKQAARKKRIHQLIDVAGSIVWRGVSLPLACGKSIPGLPELNINVKALFMFFGTWISPWGEIKCISILLFSVLLWLQIYFPSHACSLL